MAFSESHLQDAMFDGGFAESILYSSKGANPPASIRAIVDRNAPAGVDPVTGSLSSVVLVTVRNDAEKGIAAADIDTGRDRITITDRVGGANKTMKIVRIVSHDAGVVNLEVK